jgi:hypothetical protein
MPNDLLLLEDAQIKRTNKREFKLIGSMPQ